jgi:hypothetical protein
MQGPNRPAPRRGRLVLLAVAMAAGALLVAAPAQGREDKSQLERKVAQAAAALEGATARAQAAGIEYARASQQLPGAERAVE